MRIQHNIPAMNAYRNYNNNAAKLSKNLEKLSSGYKINRAGDDAAGLAISEKMRAQITGLDAAGKNVKDGISLVKTAEGAMQEVQDMLNRMKYLATQSSNGTYQNEVDRENLQKEVDALKTEINRIADSANFNGQKLLNGDLARQDVTKGGMTDLTVNALHDAVLGETAKAGKYTIDLTQVKFEQKGQNAGDLTFTIGGSQIYDSVTEAAGQNPTAGTATTLTGKLTVGGTLTGTDIGNLVNNKYVIIDNEAYKISHDGAGKLTLTGTRPAQNAATTALDVDLQATNSVQPGGANLGNQGPQISVTVDQAPVVGNGRAYAQGDITFTAGQISDGKTIKIGDTSYTIALGHGSKFAGGPNVIDMTDIKANDTNRHVVFADRLSKVAKNNAQFIVGSDHAGKITLTEKEGGFDTSSPDYKLTGANAAPNDQTATDWAGLVQMGSAATDATFGGLSLQIGDTADQFNQLNVFVDDIHVDALGLDNMNISTQVGAQAAIKTITDAINSVSATRGDLGAVQNRLEHTQNNLSVMKENIQDAEATIRDTDVADEMTAYTKNNILLQSAQAMLAQANQMPQGVLQLLQ